MLKIRNNKRLVGLLILLFMVALVVAIIYGIGAGGLIKLYLQMIHYSFLAYIAGIVIIVFIDKNEAQVTITWLIMFFIEPYVAFILYMLLGRNSYKRYLVKKMKELGIEDFKRNHIKDISLNKLSDLIKNSHDSPITENNNITVLNNGSKKFALLFEKLMEAKDHINIEYFIIKNDYIGNRLKEILILKAREGVKVRIIIDAVGSWAIGKKYIRDLKFNAIEVKLFSPVLFPILSRELNYRNHRKIVVIDSKYAFIGGVNVGNEYLGLKKQFGYWRDTHIMLEGSSVFNIQKVFLKDWAFVNSKKFELESRYFKKHEVEGNKKVQIIAGGPDQEYPVISQAIFTMINMAKKRLWITTPYLVPDESISRAIVTASLSGVDVRIIIPDKADHYLVYWATRDNLTRFLEAGVKIYRYSNGFIHAKTIIVDDDIATVGTANIDMRSFELNYEINALIYDEDVVTEIERDFITDFNNSELVDYNKHINRAFYKKILESIGRIIAPLQ